MTSLRVLPKDKRAIAGCTLQSLARTSRESAIFVEECAVVPGLSRAVMFVCGFALWAVFALQPWDSDAPMREGWDVASYWSIGVPMLALAQAVVSGLSREALARQPLWVLAGHLSAMLMLHPAGNDFGLLPLAIVFIYVPGYGALLLVALVGREIARSLR